MLKSFSAYVVVIFFMSVIKYNLCLAHLLQMSWKNNVITHLTSKKNTSADDSLKHFLMQI